MGLLTQATRQELVTLLADLPGIDRLDQRDVLLRDLPLSVVQQIARSAATVPDLEAIVARADLWWPPDGPVSDYPLRLLVTAALGLAAESQIAAALQAFLERLPATLDASARPRCPYPGMAPFSSDDARFFYGRAPEIAEMLRRLRVGRYLLVIGPSGSGKSSLVTAGLLPVLARQQPGAWQVVTMRPGATPNTALGAVLPRQLTKSTLLLIVDQFEELFTQADRQQQLRFLASLTKLRTRPDCALILIMRADFYPDLMQSPLWPPGVGERLEIAPLTGDALRAAIVWPAADVGVEIEPSLVERLVADAADEPGSLPLLQEALVLLWEQLRGRMLRLADYEALGREGRSGLAVALALRADATYNGRTPEQQKVARRIFLRLIAFGEGRPDTRRQQPVVALQVPGEDPALFGETLAVLTNHRLLTMSGEGQAAGVRRVDIAHEALIRGWPLLQSWLAERRTAEQTRRRLEEQAAEWVRLGRGAGGLLDAAELPEAERWLSSPDAEDLGVSVDLRALVTASHNALATARHAQAAANRRLRAIAAGLAVALLLALVGGVVAVQGQQLAQAATTREAQQRQTAEAQGRVARSQALAANAEAQLAQNPELSVLLAMEAVKISLQNGATPMPQAEGMLHRVLRDSPLRKMGPTWDVGIAEFSPDGRSVLGSNWANNNMQLWDLASQQLRFVVSTSLEKAQFSPNGSSLLVNYPESFVELWDVQTGRIQHRLGDHVTTAAYSSDGQHVATVSGASISIWDSIDGQLLHTLAPLPAIPVALTYGPHGRLLISYSKRDSTSAPAQLWDAEQGQLLRTLSELGSLAAADYNPAGDLVAVTSYDPVVSDTVQLYDIEHGQVVARLPGHSGGATSAQFSPDGRYLLVSGAPVPSSMTHVWEVATQKSVLSIRALNQGIFSADGKRLLTAADEATQLWDLNTGVVLTTLRGAQKVAFSSDEQWIYTLCCGFYSGARADPSVLQTWWVSGTGEEYPSVAGFNPAVSRDGRIVSTLDQSTQVIAAIWDSASGERLRSFTICDHCDECNETCEAQSTRARFSGDGSRILVTTFDGLAGRHPVSTAWDATTGQLLSRSGGWVNAQYTPDDRFLVSASPGGVAQVLDGRTERPLMTLQKPLMALLGDQLSWVGDDQQGQTLATLHGGAVQVWDMATGEELWHTASNYLTARIDPSGRYLLLIPMSSNPYSVREVEIHDLRKGTLIYSFPEQVANYAADGRLLVGGGLMSTPIAIRAGDAMTNEVRTRLPLSELRQPSAAHPLGWITELVFSPNGQYLAAASNEGMVAIWDTAHWQLRTTLHCAGPASHWAETPIRSAGDLAFTPDSRRLLVACGTGADGAIIRQYALDPDDLVKTAVSRVGRTFTPEERATYLGDPLPTSTELSPTPAATTP